MTQQNGTLGFWRRRRFEIILFVIAFVARAGAGLYLTRDDTTMRYPDESWYWRMAESVRAGDGLVGEYGHRAGRMPLYPAFLSLFAGSTDHVAYVRAAQWGIGALGALFVLWLGEAMGRRSVGAIAAMLFALDPALCGSASLVLTETVFVTMMAALWWAAWPRSAAHRSRALDALAVVAAVACVMTRESSLPIVGLLCLWSIITGWRPRNYQITAQGLMVIVAVGLALTVWGYRNAVVLGKWHMLTTRGGISLFDGVKPGATGASDLAKYKSAVEVIGLNETEWNAYFLKKSYESIAAEPGCILRLVPKKLARTWSPIPNAGDLQSPMVRIIFGLWYVPLMLMVVVGIWSIRRDSVILVGCLIPAVCICVVHSVYVGSLRYRLVAMPTLTILAALGVTWIIACTWRSPPDANVDEL